MNNNIEDLEDLSTPSKNSSDEIDELVFDEDNSLNNTDVEDLDSFAKEAGMLTRVFLSPAFTLNVKLIFGC